MGGAFLIAALIAVLPAGETPARQLLEDTARKYQEIGSYEYSAVATRPLQGGFTGKVGLKSGYASPKMTPPELPVPMLNGGQAGLIGVFDPQGEPARPELHSVATPVLPPLDEIAWRVASAKVAGAETVQSHKCQIVSVLYEGKRQNTNGSSVRYWIDPKTKTIWKMQFSEIDPLSKTGELADWTVTWDAWVENQAPSAWLIHAGQWPADERPALIGRQAPQITGHSLSGEPFQLSKLRGMVVVLDFWGTWCGPCSEEMAALERLKASLPNTGIEIWSVAEDRPDAAKRWLKERGRTLPAVIVPEHSAFKSYGVDVLPQVVIVSPQGTVVHQSAGLKKESDLRQAVEALLSE
ncbi:MAG: TlpA family protein disulfide reductase [Candidatus Sulfotelmatobacter sp.]